MDQEVRTDEHRRASPRSQAAKKAAKKAAKQAARQSAAIHLQDVSLALASPAGTVDILRHVSLDISPGERVAIVGPSGSGKTSLLMVMAGLEPASSGHVLVAGQELAGRSEDELAEIRRDHMGVIFQSFHLVPTMTALENVMLPLEFANHANPETLAREALQAVGLSHRTSHYPAQLSGGEQQRVAIARALAPQPPVLLADEPTGNLDAATGKEIADLMFDLSVARDMTFVLVTHDLKLAQRCERIVEIFNGQIAPANPPPHQES